MSADRSDSRDLNTRSAEAPASDAEFHRMLAELLLAENDFRGAYREVTAALRLAPADARSQALYTQVLQTQSLFFRGLLRLQSHLVDSRICRTLALVALMLVGLLGASVSRMSLPPDVQGGWAFLLYVGFLALVWIVSEPEHATNFLWYFAKSGRVAAPATKETDDVSEETAEQREISP